MISSPALAASLFALSGLCAPSSLYRQRDETHIVGQWSLLNFYRQCEGAECTYSFLIQESPDQPGDPCRFEVSGAAQGRPGSQADFQNAVCATDPDVQSPYKVNGGWDPSGFITIVVTDTVRDAYAFFGYRDTELQQGQVETKTSAAYRVGTFGPGDALAPALKVARDAPEADGDEKWQVLNMTRKYLAGQHTTLLDFTIFLLKSGKLERCNINVPNTNHDSTFWAIPCGQRNGYTISWGYKDDTDGAVMTICNAEEYKNAWFGWDHINQPGRSFLGDSTKNDVREITCQ